MLSLLRFFLRCFQRTRGHILFLTAFLSACTTPGVKYSVDKTVQTPNQDSRAQFLVLHYTAQSLADSLKILTDPKKEVSAHYLIPDAPERRRSFHVYRLANEDRRAWHAGVSFWRGNRLLNPGSIGIETVNLGFPEADESLPLMQRRWYPYPPDQIEVV